MKKNTKLAIDVIQFGLWAAAFALAMGALIYLPTS